MADRKESIRAMINALIFDKTDEAKPNLSAAMTEHSRMFFGMPSESEKQVAENRIEEGMDDDVTVAVSKPVEFQDETADEVAEDAGVTLKVLKSKLKVSGSSKNVKKFLKTVVFADLKPKDFKAKCEEEFPELC